MREVGGGRRAESDEKVDEKGVRGKRGVGGGGGGGFSRGGHWRGCSDRER